MKCERSFCEALSLSLLTIFSFTVAPLAPLAAWAQPSSTRLSRPGHGVPAPASENIVVSPNTVTKLTGGVKEQHRLNLAIAIVKTWPGGIAPTPPAEAAPAATPAAVPLQSMQGEADDSASGGKASDNIAEAFPDQTPSYMPGNSYDVPGTTKTTSTTTTNSTTSTTSSTDWGNSSFSNSQSSNSKWKSSQKSRGGTHMGGFGLGGFFSGFGGFGAGLSGLGLGGLGYGFGMPHLRMPSFNLGAYGGFAMGGGLGLYGLWNGYKHSKKSRGSSNTSSIANNNRSWGNTTTNNVSNETTKTTTTTETTPGYTVEQAGSGICPVPAETRPVAALTAPAQPEVPPAAAQTQPLPAVSHPVAIAAAPAVKPNRLVVVPWDDWYRCFAAEVYQRWSADEPYAGDALAAITVTDTKEISVALLPNDSPPISAEEKDNFDRCVVACLAKFNHDKAIAMPKESRRKSVTFVLGFSAEEDGPSGCQAVSMADSEQY